MSSKTTTASPEMLCGRPDHLAAELDVLLVREKARTLAKGTRLRRPIWRLPMVEVESTIVLIGPHGPLTLLEVFEHRRQLIAYFQMWYAGQPGRRSVRPWYSAQDSADALPPGRQVPPSVLPAARRQSSRDVLDARPRR